MYFNGCRKAIFKSNIGEKKKSQLQHWHLTNLQLVLEVLSE